MHMLRHVASRLTDHRGQQLRMRAQGLGFCGHDAVRSQHKRVAYASAVRLYVRPGGAESG
jgi:hypothetical protein